MKKIFSQKPNQSDASLEDSAEFFSTKSTSPEINLSQKERGFFSWFRVFLFIIILLVISGALFAYRAFSSIQSIMHNEDSTPIVEQLKYLVSSEEKKVQGEDTGYVNFLFLGMGGSGHPGGQLTDTIMVANINIEKDLLTLVSIPRDLVYNFPNQYYRKVNNGFVIGEQIEGEGKGGSYMSEVIGDIIGQDIHYYTWLDFAGFRNIIDDLGGINVHVDNTFTDYQYPDYNYGWQTIHFDEGLSHFDGETALQYSRSRHGNNGEGSDFKRSERQKKVILATKDKLFSAYTVFNPATVSNLLDTLGDHVRTNVEYWEILRFASLLQDVRFDETVQYSVDNSAGGLLHSETGDSGAYVLVPNAGLGNYEEIHTTVNELITGETDSIILTTNEKPLIHVRNGTKINGLAKSSSDILVSHNYQVESIGNAPKLGYEKTVIYDFSGVNPESLSAIRKLLNANVAPSIPSWLEEEFSELANKEAIDFLIVVGDNSGSTSELLNDTTSLSSL